MSKFCGKCGAKLDVSTGLCPRCNAQQLLTLQNNVKPSEVSSQVAQCPNIFLQKRKNRHTKRFFSTIIVLLTVLICTASITGFLTYWGIIEIPAMNYLLKTLGIQTSSKLENICSDYAERARIVSHNEDGTYVMEVVAPDFPQMVKDECQDSSSFRLESFYQLLDRSIENRDFPKRTYQFTVENDDPSLIREAFLQQVTYDLMISAITEVEMEE